MGERRFLLNNIENFCAPRMAGRKRRYVQSAKRTMPLRGVAGGRGEAG